LSCPGATTLVVNGSFEDVGGSTLTGQALLPVSWTAITLSPDTYSNDGSYGLLPGGFGHFPGGAAFDGIRWVAGGSFPETLGQALAASVQPGVRYTVSAAIRRDTGATPGTGSYEVRLKSTLLSTTFVVAGRFAEPVGTGWETFAFDFALPVAGPAYAFVELVPFASGAQVSYPGIDAFSIVQVSNCQ
jgi:hypothetical protein